MRKIQAQPLTPTSWILSDQGSKVGVLTSDGACWYVLGVNVKGEAASIEILEEVMDWQVTFAEPADLEQKPASDLEGLPIKHANPCNVEKTPQVTYTKTERSNTRYAAGYWAIQFANGWSGSLCPKMATLDEYPHEGPFGHKLELNTVLTNKNRRK